MAQITNTDVFDFMGTETDIRTQHSTTVTNLVARAIKEIEHTIGRKIEKETVTDVLFENNRNCSIIGDTLFLKGKYRDLYSLSSISENGTALTAVADSNDGGGYYLDSESGVIKRVNQQWSSLHNAVKLSGDLGLVDSSEETPVDLKQVIVEIAAVKSGLWKSYYNGEEFTVRDLTAPTKRLLNSYKVRDF